MIGATAFGDVSVSRLVREVARYPLNSMGKTPYYQSMYNLSIHIANNGILDHHCFMNHCCN
jgi:hypothetical protein